MTDALAQRLADPAVNGDRGAEDALGAATQARAVSYTAQQVVGYALAVTGKLVIPPGGESAPRPRPARRQPLPAVMQLVTEHASVSSVWFRNSTRGAVGLAIAVYIAHRAGGHHAFWVVVGAFSVLRSSALSTSRSIARVLAGTVLGIALGAALIAAIGNNEPLLWAVLPPAVLVASYAPKVFPVVPGQFGFAVVLLVTFNLIQPSGWQIGLVRIEDVAIGCAVSLVVGLLFWPRGAARLLHENLAVAYRCNAEYAAAAAADLIGRASRGATTAAARAAAIAADRLEDAFRQYLAERNLQPPSRQNLAALVAGAARARQAGRSMAALAGPTAHSISLEPCIRHLDAEVEAMHSGFVALGDAVLHANAVLLPRAPDNDGQRLLGCVRRALGADGRTTLVEALDVLQASQHLAILRQIEKHLQRAASAESSDALSTSSRSASPPIGTTWSRSNHGRLS